MNTFEENFPSLTNLTIIGGGATIEEINSDSYEDRFLKSDIEKQCLDKQRVKEAFEEFTDFNCSCENEATRQRIIDYKNKLLKDLGL